MRELILNILTDASDATLAKCLVNAYVEIEENFAIKKWKASELDAGHFVEAMRRFLELKFIGSYTPLSKQLAPFNDAILKGYEQSSGNESYRILIPQILKAIYSIRNKRGVGHLATISPNEMDATVILYSSKWILAEVIRIESQLSLKESEGVIKKLIQRQIETIWIENDIERILNTKFSVSAKVLVLLLVDSPRTAKDLQNIIDSKDTKYFRKVLVKLHNERLIEYKNDSCYISPLGLIKAEELILNEQT